MTDEKKTDAVADPGLKGTVLTLSIEDLDMSNYRDIGETADLEQSILQTGLLQPITVYKSGKGRYSILDGHRRVHAMKNLGMKEVKANQIDAMANHEILQIAINEVKKNHTIFEVAVIIKKLVEEDKMQQTLISKTLGKEKGVISRYYSVVKNYNAPLYAYLSGKALYVLNDSYHLDHNELIKKDAPIEDIKKITSYKLKKSQLFFAGEPLAKLLDEIKDDAEKLGKFNIFVTGLIRKNKTGKIEKLVEDFKAELLSPDKPKEKKEKTIFSAKVKDRMEKYTDAMIGWIDIFKDDHEEFQKNINNILLSKYKDKKLKIIIEKIK